MREKPNSRYQAYMIAIYSLQRGNTGQFVEITKLIFKNLGFNIDIPIIEN